MLSADLPSPSWTWLVCSAQALDQIGIWGTLRPNQQPEIVFFNPFLNVWSVAGCIIFLKEATANREYWYSEGALGLQEYLGGTCQSNTCMNVHTQGFLHNIPNFKTLGSLLCIWICLNYVCMCLSHCFLHFTLIHLSQTGKLSWLIITLLCIKETTKHQEGNLSRLAQESF